MKTLKDAYRAVELGRERAHLIKSAQAQSIFAASLLSVSAANGQYPAVLEVKECREQFKNLIHDELNAQREKIDQELIAMGIDPRAEDDPASTAKVSADGEYAF